MTVELFEHLTKDDRVTGRDGRALGSELIEEGKVVAECAAASTTRW
ncbi:hypothetical protein C5F59_024130 [Streptomyces sp. QL37]|nr:hypothetical protein [Streptomyces sp. QL37]